MRMLGARSETKLRRQEQQDVVVNNEEDEDLSWCDDDGSTTCGEDDGEVPTAEGSEMSSKNSGSKDSSSLAQKETVAVNRSKVLMYVALLLSATLIGTGTYLFLSSQQQADFSANFHSFAKEIMDNSDFNALVKFELVQGMATLITSHALATNATFPFVTLPNFDQHAKQALGLSGSEAIAYCPIVPKENKTQWEAYASAEVSMGNDNNNSATSTSRHVIYPSSHHEEEEEGENGGNFVSMEFSDFYVPLWQLGPSPSTNASSIIMMDLFTHPTFRRVMRDVMEIEHVLLSEVVRLDFMLKYSVMALTTDDSPRSFVVQPVFDDFNYDDEHDNNVTTTTTRNAESTNNPNAKLVGFVVAVLPWKGYFERVLPDEVEGLLVEVQDTCGSEFSYLIDGFDATYLGGGGEGSEQRRRKLRRETTTAATGDTNDDDDEGDSNATIAGVKGEDLKLSRYPNLKREARFAEFAMYDGDDADDLDTTHCVYTKTVYPTEAFRKCYVDSTPRQYTVFVLLVFCFTALVFVLYDVMVQRRQEKVLDTATRTSKIVSSLFPSSVHERMMMQQAQQQQQAQQNSSQRQRQQQQFKQEQPLQAQDNTNSTSNSPRRNSTTAQTQLQDFLSDDHPLGGGGGGGIVSAGSGNSISKGTIKTMPIADLFQNVTIFFGDLVGFTAWSSMREPSQVFILLETIYSEFDKIAARRRVYKVETIGDCYVAVAGLPEPLKDHQTAMARFARDCLMRMQTLTKRLEVELGPETADLGMRIGLHSGAVTAGVLRGTRARFQLFGDTVNTTARMESTGAKNRIHMSQETADLLIANGKAHWVREREGTVVAKGKGELQTYWLVTGDNSNTESPSDDSRSPSYDMTSETNVDSPDPCIPKASDTPKAAEKHARLIDWNCEMLGKILKNIVAQRKVSGSVVDAETKMQELEKTAFTSSKMTMEEVTEEINLPMFNAKAGEGEQPDQVKVTLSDDVLCQLHDYVYSIASLYPDHPFHNFEHASHVAMSTSKLLHRIVVHNDQLRDKGTPDQGLRDLTGLIASDELLQFAVVFSSLIHDVGHAGVPNSQLAAEQATLAKAYQNQSILEQNSIDLAWALLMEDKYKDLRRTIYVSEGEFRRFRSLVVNSVIATDITDKRLNARRAERWNDAFAKNSQDSGDDVNRRATLVIEYLVQASDIAHTMQHWMIYRRWNANLFQELYLAHASGRCSDDRDPAEYWYDRELEFFDNCVIPLAERLRGCGVFGVASDEYLTYAQNNRREFERKGRGAVADMTQGAPSWCSSITT